jgi:serine/threonine-protein kinase
MGTHIDRIGKFELLDRLGEGGLGEVFLARDTLIGREVALKIIRKGCLPDPDAVDRFLKECQAVGRLSHPNLATLQEAGEKGGIVFTVMDYVDGNDLGTVLQAGACTPQEILGLAAQICDALGYIHRQGLLHRNLKPDNVRMGRVSGRPAPRLLDAALPRLRSQDAAGAAARLASLRYTAPECLSPGGKPDCRCDLFAVGVILQEALTGVHPFAGEDAAAVTQRVLQEEPPALEPDRFPELSPSIQGILRQALAKDPARRYPSAEAMAAALRSARDPAWTPGVDRLLEFKPAKPRPVRPQPRRSPTNAAWVATALVLALLGLASGYWMRGRRQAQAAHRPEADQVQAALPAAPSAPAEAAPPLVAPPSSPVPAKPAPAPSSPAPAKPAPAPSSPAPAKHAPPPSPPVPTKPAPAQSSPAPASLVPAPSPSAPAQPAAPADLPGSAYHTLDEAAAALDTDPQGALAYLEPAFAAQPGDERAAALRITALYKLARYGACSRAIRDARAAGHELWPMALRQPPLRKILEQDAKDPHLPRRKPTPPPAVEADQASNP